jgi:hypothetical protein
MSVALCATNRSRSDRLRSVVLDLYANSGICFCLHVLVLDNICAYSKSISATVPNRYQSLTLASESL